MNHPDDREWHDDTLNQAQHVLEEIARVEMQQNAVTFVDWLLDIRDAFELTPIVGAAMNADPAPLREFLTTLERDYIAYRVDLAQGRSEWRDLCRSIEDECTEDV